MRIAFITSEFSGLPGSGGIGSYFLQAARCLAAAGQEIEVFTSGIPGELRPEKGIVFHQLGESNSRIFAVHAADAFAARDKEAPFDILESAELNAEGAFAAAAAPEVAHVVRMHSPSILLNEYLDVPPSKWQRIVAVLKQMRISIGAWRQNLPVPPIQLNAPCPAWFSTRYTDERNVTAAADVVIVMSEEMRHFVRESWWIQDEAIVQVANPLQQSTVISQPSKKGNQFTLAFVGRLEPRKGVLPLAKALEEVLPEHSDWNVVFVGRSVLSCLSGVDAGEIAKDRLKPFGSRVKFIESIPPEEMGAFLSGVDLCVYPSLWDNFPYVVLEAMAMGKAIIATRVGAVSEMLDHGKAGMLVDPGSVGQLKRALELLMNDPVQRKQLGDAARQRATSEYSEGSVTRAILEAYRLALNRRDRRSGNKPAATVAIS